MKRIFTTKRLHGASINLSLLSNELRNPSATLVGVNLKYGITS